MNRLKLGLCRLAQLVALGCDAPTSTIIGTGGDLPQGEVGATSARAQVVVQAEAGGRAEATSSPTAQVPPSADEPSVASCGSYRLAAPTLAQDLCAGLCPALGEGMQWRVEPHDGGFLVTNALGSSFAGTTSSVGLSFGTTVQAAAMSPCTQSQTVILVTLRARGAQATGTYQTNATQSCPSGPTTCSCSYQLAGTFLSAGS